MRCSTALCSCLISLHELVHGAASGIEKRGFIAREFSPYVYLLHSFPTCQDSAVAVGSWLRRPRNEQTSLRYFNRDCSDHGRFGLCRLALFQRKGAAYLQCLLPRSPRSNANSCSHRWKVRNLLLPSLCALRTSTGRETSPDNGTGRLPGWSGHLAFSGGSRS